MIAMHSVSAHGGGGASLRFFLTLIGMSKPGYSAET
jgi:hypothetical protein